MNRNPAFETDRQVQLHWHCKSKPGVIAPHRFLTEYGVIETPVQGMVDEDRV